MATLNFDLEKLVPLTISQTIQWLDAYHELRRSEMIIVSDDSEVSTTLCSGKLTDVKANGEISFLSDEEEPQTFKLKGKEMLIVFKKKEAKYVTKIAPPDTKKLTIKVLIGLLQITVLQAVKWLDSYDYRLRGSKMVILSNDREVPAILYSGELTDINENGEISFLSDEEEPQTFNLKENGIIIVFAGDKARYAIFNR